MFGRATIRLGIGPHSSLNLILKTSNFCTAELWSFALCCVFVFLRWWLFDCFVDRSIDLLIGRPIWWLIDYFVDCVVQFRWMQGTAWVERLFSKTTSIKQLPALWRFSGSYHCNLFVAFQFFYVAVVLPVFFCAASMPADYCRKFGRSSSRPVVVLFWCRHSQH